MMRWDDLFADLAAQWEAETRRELDAEVADRTRRERARVGLHERLAAAGQQVVTVALRSGARVTGRVVDVGDGWLLLRAEAGGPLTGPLLVPFAGVMAVTGSRRESEGPPWGAGSAWAMPCGACLATALSCS
jgi:hypothetical protein